MDADPNYDPFGMKAAKRKIAKEYEDSKKGQNWNTGTASEDAVNPNELIEPYGENVGEYFRMCHRKHSNLCLAVDEKYGERGVENSYYITIQDRKRDWGWRTVFFRHHKSKTVRNFKMRDYAIGFDKSDKSGAHVVLRKVLGDFQNQTASDQLWV